MIQGFIEGWARFVIKRRWFVIILTILLLLGLMFPMKNLYFDNSSESFFITGDKALVSYDQLTDRFGSSLYLMVGLEAREGESSVITADNLRVIAQITEFLEDHEYVTKVASLTNYQYIKSQDDVLQVNNLIEDIDTLTDTPAEIKRIKDIMTGETLVHDYLITEDLAHTIIVAKVIRKKGEMDYQVELVNDLNRFLKAGEFEKNGYRFHFTGNPIIGENFVTATMKDTSTMMPIMFILVLAFLWLAFRRISGVLMPLVVIFGSVISVLGVIGLFNWSLNSINTILPILLITIGIGDSVHIIVEFFHLIEENRSSKEAAELSVRNLFIPCFYTSLTTSLGFLAIASTQLRIIREFGIVAAIGVTLAFIISVSTLPALLSLLNDKRLSKKKRLQSGLVTRLTESLTEFTFRHNKSIVVVAVILIATAAGLASRIKIDTNFVNSFKKDTVIRQDFTYFEDVYNGGLTLEFMIDSGKEGGIKEPAFLKQTLQFQEYLESQDKIGKSNSMINYLRKMNQSMHNDDPAFYAIPDSRELVAQLLFLYTNSSPEEDLSDLISFDERFIRLSVSLKNMPTSKMEILVEEIEKKLQTSYPDLIVTIAGETILWNNMSAYIQQGIISSYSIAFVTIAICFFVLLRSFKYAFLSIILSLSPIIIAGGLMGLMGIDLDFSTMIVAAVCFGIAVDDTIHVMTRYIASRKNGSTRKESLHTALTQSGRALIFTTIILYFGFSILMLSSFVPNIYFGFFSGIILVIALVSVLLLLPAIIFLQGDKT